MIAVSDDDWFERALRDDEGEPDGTENADAEDAEDAGADDGAGAEHEKPDGDRADGPNGGVVSDSEIESGRDGPDDRADDGSTRAGGGDSPFGDGNEGGSPFDEDFASALQSAPDPGMGSGQPPEGAGGAEGEGGDPFGGSGQNPEGPPFGGGQGGGDPFGGGQDPGGSPFGGGGDDKFGFGDFGGGDDLESFDDAEFESNLERLDVGIDGLDQMILGGVPRRSLMVAIGSAGTGKTTFGLQFLHHGLQQGEDGVYITLEESYGRIISTADEKGWGFGEYVDDDRLAVVDIDPIEMANSLDSIQNDLPNLIEGFGADRLVLDSVSLLEMMYESAPRRRSQVFGFARALKQAGITILLTSEADRNHAYASRFGIVEYLADAVFVLQYVRPSDFQETRLAIEIQKIRDANHSRETKPYDLTDEGISVYRQANIF